MKFRITLKDPDGVYDSVADATRKYSVDREELYDVVNQWFRYSEYVTIEIDTEANTASVLPAK